MQKYNLFVIIFYFKKYDLNFYLVYHFGKYIKKKFCFDFILLKKVKKNKEKRKF